MKKTLYSTTGLVAAGLVSFGAGQAFAQAAAPAKAEPLQIKVGGYMTQAIGYADNSGKFEKAVGSGGQENSYHGFDVKNDSEIYFSGSVKLDNGMTVAVNVQYEADLHGAGGIDESYMRVSGDFGQVDVGSTNAAGFSLAVQAPAAGLFPTTSPDIANWIVPPAANVARVAGIDVGVVDNNKVVYISPSLSGFRVGASFQPQAAASAAQPQAGVSTEQWDAAVQWSGAVGDAKVRAYAGFWNTRGAASTADADNKSVGADVKFGDITVGGGYLSTTNETPSASTSTSNPDKIAYNAGVKYDPAGYSLSLGYYRTEATGSTATAGDDTVSRWVAGGTYDLGPGVVAGVQIAHDSYNDELNAAAAENSGTAIIGGIKVSF